MTVANREGVFNRIGQVVFGDFHPVWMTKNAVGFAAFKYLSPVSEIRIVRIPFVCIARLTQSLIIVNVVCTIPVFRNNVIHLQRFDVR